MLLSIYIWKNFIIKKDDLINVIKKDAQIRIKFIDMLDGYNRLPCNYQLKIGCDSLIQNVVIKELIKKTGYYNNR